MKIFLWTCVFLFITSNRPSHDCRCLSPLRADLVYTIFILTSAPSEEAKRWRALDAWKLLLLLLLWFGGGRWKHPSAQCDCRVPPFGEGESRSAAELRLSYSKSRENCCNNSKIASLHREQSLFFFLKTCLCGADKVLQSNLHVLFVRDTSCPLWRLFSAHSPHHCSISRTPEVNCCGFMDVSVFLYYFLLHSDTIRTKLRSIYIGMFDIYKVQPGSSPRGRGLRSWC